MEYIVDKSTVPHSNKTGFSLKRELKKRDILDEVTFLKDLNRKKIPKSKEFKNTKKSELKRLAKKYRRQEEIQYEIDRDQWYHFHTQPFDISDPNFAYLRKLRKYNRKLNKEIKKRE